MHQSGSVKGVAFKYGDAMIHDMIDNVEQYKTNESTKLDSPFPKGEKTKT